MKDHHPRKCLCCGEDLPEKACTDLDPIRHQVWDLPRVQAEVAEHRLHRAKCPKCGEVSIADLPRDVPRGNFGPDLSAMIALLVGKYRLSRRQCQSILKTGFGVGISLGCINKTEEMVSNAIEKAATEILPEIQKSKVVNGDDTSWTENNGNVTLWNVNTPTLAYYQITETKELKTAKKLLGNFDGIFGSDRAKTYGFIPVERSQTCLGHVDRHFQRMEDRGGESALIGKWGKAEFDRFFHHWHEFKDGKITRDQLEMVTAPVRANMHWLLECGIECSHSKTANTCVNLSKALPSFWTCIKHEGVEPTNNVSERALRHPVQWRRTSFGTKSDKGSRFVERLLTIGETCRLQGRNLLELLKHSVVAHMLGAQGPSLIPQGPAP